MPRPRSWPRLSKRARRPCRSRTATRPASSRSGTAASSSRRTVVGMCAFLAPGLFNAMSATGAGGSEKVYVVNAANAALYALQTVFCACGAFFTNRIGFRFTLALGAAGFAVYAGGLYANLVHGTIWFVVFGAALNGISGGLFWACEGAIMVGYPQPAKVGRYMGLWLAWRNGGSVVGGAIVLGLNATLTSSSVSRNTYIVFIVLQCIGPFIAMFLSEPDKVQRPDGTAVKMRNSAPFVPEAKAIYRRVLTRWDVLVMIPIMLYCTWFYAYAGTFVSLYYNTRSRALASFVTSVASILANVVLGVALDYHKMALRTRARAIYIAVFALNIGMWIWFIVMQTHFMHHPPAAKLDWLAGPKWYAGWGVYVMGIIIYNINTNLLYWIISTLSADGKDAIRLIGVLRAFESAGAACGYGMSASSGLSHYVPLFFDFALCVIGFSLALPVVFRIGTPAALRESLPEDDAAESDVPQVKH